MSKTLVIGILAGALLVFTLVGLFLWQMKSSSAPKQQPVQQTPPPPVPSPQPQTLVTSNWQTYRDEERGFEVKYPSAFGIPSVGTSRDLSGTDDRGVAIKFSEFSAGVRGGAIILEGEAVLTTGRIWVTAQALGGAHDVIILGSLIGAFPPPLKASLFKHAESLALSNFCEELAKEQHLDPADPAITSLTAAKKEATLNLSVVRNVDPKVIRCEVSGDTITFHKEAAFDSNTPSPRQHIYGAIRFLDLPYSSFQLIRITNDAPSNQLLQEMNVLVGSLSYSL